MIGESQHDTTCVGGASAAKLSNPLVGCRKTFKFAPRRMRMRMKRNVMMKIGSAGVLSSLLLAAQVTASAQTALTLGGFDSTRGGEFSLAQGSQLTTLRSAIATAYPYATLTASPTLGIVNK
jgi:hypothetical protein